MFAIARKGIRHLTEGLLFFCEALVFIADRVKVLQGKASIILARLRGRVRRRELIRDIADEVLMRVIPRDI